MKTKYAEEVARAISDGLAMRLTPSNEAMEACRRVKQEVEKALTSRDTYWKEQMEKRNGVIKEYEDQGVMFVLKIEGGKTYEASMPRPKWVEVGKLEMREHEHEWTPCPGRICTSDLHTHHCNVCGKHGMQGIGSTSDETDITKEG